MIARSAIPSLTDIVEACALLRAIRDRTNADAFEKDRETRWTVERGIEIISEASRRLPEELKGRHPTIPWKKIAGIGSVLRHNYDSVSGPVLWVVLQQDLEPLELACGAELAREQQA
jgi:uncharacterized protein with HEPN domain